MIPIQIYMIIFKTKFLYQNFKIKKEPGLGDPNPGLINLNLK